MDAAVNHHWGVQVVDWAAAEEGLNIVLPPAALLASSAWAVVVIPSPPSQRHVAVQQVGADAARLPDRKNEAHDEACQLRERDCRWVCGRALQLARQGLHGSVLLRQGHWDANQLLLLHHPAEGSKVRDHQSALRTGELGGHSAPDHVIDETHDAHSKLLSPVPQHWHVLDDGGEDAGSRADSEGEDCEAVHFPQELCK
eukprot:2535013-Rhodomonas_salina.1